VQDDLIVNSSITAFKKWVHQREQSSSRYFLRCANNMHEDGELSTYDNIDRLLHETFRNLAEGFDEHQEFRKGLGMG